jgi:enoyl-CoA hydratase/carnithine racemase
MSEPRLIFEKKGVVARVQFDNPRAHNALTHEMWVDLRDAARAIAADPSIRVATFRGVGGKAFISGTDISGFTDFKDGQDGVIYERGIDEFMAAVDAIPAVTIAIVDGWAVGGGLNIVATCDFRIATPNARFGSPIGRTIGNCLSMSSATRIANAIGVQAVKRMVLLGEMIPASELLASGFLYKIVEPDQIDTEAEALIARAAENAPLTTRVTKEMIRLAAKRDLPDVEALIAKVYGSNDFRRGVHNFLAKSKTVPDWTGD